MNVPIPQLPMPELPATEAPVPASDEAGVSDFGAALAEWLAGPPEAERAAAPLPGRPDAPPEERQAQEAGAETRPELGADRAERAPGPDFAGELRGATPPAPEVLAPRPGSSAAPAPVDPEGAGAPPAVRAAGPAPDPAPPQESARPGVARAAPSPPAVDPISNAPTPPPPDPAPPPAAQTPREPAARPRAQLEPAAAPRAPAETLAGLRDAAPRVEAAAAARDAAHAPASAPAAASAASERAETRAPSRLSEPGAAPPTHEGLGSERPAAPADAPRAPVVPPVSTAAPAPSAETAALAAPGAPSEAPARAAEGLPGGNPPPELPAAAEEIPLRVEWLARRGGGTARVALHPPHLGHVELTVRLRGGDVEVSILAHESAAQTLVLGQRDQLADALAARELRMTQFTVGDGGERNGADLGRGASPDEGGAFHFGRDADARLLRSEPDYRSASAAPVSRPLSDSAPTSGVDLHV